MSGLKMAQDGRDVDNVENFIETEFIEDHFTREISKNRHTYDEIAAILIKENLLLTALELHTELVESGQELPRLRDFFSNPGNFEKQAQERLDLSPGLPRTSSVQTFDSLDFARYSDDGEKQIDERVAVLEFELRKAKETIKSLRANLTFATESESNIPETKEARVSSDDTVKPHEKRALNFLVNEYLLNQNYKLTSITFSDENEDQDFEDWDDVGLNIPKPPNLLCLYRDFTRHLHPLLHCHSIGLQVNLNDEETMRQKSLREELELKILSLQEEIDSLSKTNVSLVTQIKTLEDNAILSSTITARAEEISLLPTTDSETKLLSCDLDSSEVNDSEESQVISIPEPVPLEIDKNKIVNDDNESSNNESKILPAINNVASNPLRKATSEDFHNTLLGMCYLRRNLQDSRLASEVADIADSSDKIVLMLGRCVPHIVPNVILAKREELIPVILCTIVVHPDAKERDKLLNILFNLIKRPDDDQRQMILSGFITIAQHLGPTRVQTELLPQCWEQITHKYTERRLLVAESSGVLAPYLPSEMCSSLVLSMLKQMLSEDKSELVREAVIKSLSLILLYINDDDKFTQGYELLITALEDGCENVVNAAITIFMPVFISWALELDKIESEICTAFLKIIEEKAKGLSVTSPSLLPSNEEQVFVTMIKAMRCLVPWIFISTVQSGPFVQNMKHSGSNNELDDRRFPQWQSPLEDVYVIIGDKKKVNDLVESYESYIDAEWYESWKKFDWLTKTFLPHLLSIIEVMPVMYALPVHEMSVLFHDICLMFGSKFVSTKIKPLFQSSLTANKRNASSFDDSPIAKSLVPVYINGVLKIFFKEDDRKELATFLLEVLYTTSMCQMPLDSIRTTVIELSLDSNLHELVIGVLWESVVQPSSEVRACGARLFELLVRNVSEALLANRIAPALVTLANDPDIQVRIATIPAFGAIMEVTTQKELLDKVRMQFLSFLEDPQYHDHTAVLVELIRTFGQVAPNADSRFREEFVLPHLAIIANRNASSTTESSKLSVAMALLDAYTSLSCCFLSDQLIAEVLLPGLRCLLGDVQQLAPEQAENVASMITELSSKIEISRPAERSSGSFLGASAIAPSSMEDVKNKVSKIFMGATTQGRANISSIFQSRRK